MTINFTMSDEQKKLQYDVRAFSENVLKPVVAEADAEPDPLKGFQMTKPAYVEAYKAGIAMCMLPKEYGGGGVSCVDLVIAAEEICVVDPGFACTVPQPARASRRGRPSAASSRLMPIRAASTGSEPRCGPLRRRSRSQWRWR